MKTIRILGCGSSGGVPRLGGAGALWGECDPNNPKNKRLRCSALLQKKGANGTTHILIDSSPDMRQQLLDAQVSHLDAVIYTHEHADHTHGIDDLRMITIHMKERVKVYASKNCADMLMTKFAYAFETPEGSPYPPILELNFITEPFAIKGAGGDMTITPIEVTHGTINAFGFRIDDTVYMPDVSDIPASAEAELSNVKLLILDCLRETPHPSHFNLEKSLYWIERLKAERAVLTNLHIDLDYSDLTRKTEAHIEVAFDGLTLEIV